MTEFGHETPAAGSELFEIYYLASDSVRSASKMLISTRSRDPRRQIGGAYMRVDLYTKTILTIIALLLAVFTLKPLFQPQAARADGFGSVQFSYSGGNHAFFNVNTGDVWEYGDHGNFRNHYKVREFGKDHDHDHGH
jgi:hypothetical protein